MSRKTATVHVFAPVLAAVLLAGCGAGDNPFASDAQGGSLPGASALPDCDSIGATTRGFVDGWTLDPSSGPFQHGPDNHGVSCTWLSPRAQSGNPHLIAQAAAFSININVHTRMQTEAEARSTGWVVDDPAVEALGGYILFPAGRLDFDDQLGLVGPHVTVGKVSVAVGQTGAMVVNDIDEGRPMTNRRAVDAAVAVHRLIKR